VELIHIIVGPDFLGVILIRLRGAWLFCRLRRTRNQQSKNRREREGVFPHDSSSAGTASLYTYPGGAENPAKHHSWHDFVFFQGLLAKDPRQIKYLFVPFSKFTNFTAWCSAKQGR
jgi:hypothetical protein